jgi:integrase
MFLGKAGSGIGPLLFQSCEHRAARGARDGGSLNQYGRIKTNPLVQNGGNKNDVENAHLTRPYSVKERAPTFTGEQARDIIATASGPFRVVFALAAMAGLRGREIVALQVGDFDFERQVLTVRRSAWRGKVQTAKSVRSEAVLPIPEPLAEIVREYVKSIPGQEFLFLNKCGRLFNADKIVQKQLWPLLDRLKIPRCGLHAFRHTHTSLLQDTGASAPVAQAQLRHSDARITLGVYGHIVGDAHRQAVDKVAAIWTQKDSRSYG